MMVGHLSGLKMLFCSETYFAVTHIGHMHVLFGLRYFEIQVRKGTVGQNRHSLKVKPFNLTKSL